MYSRHKLLPYLVGIITFHQFFCFNADPVVTLGPDCPDGGYSLSSTFNCSCILTTPGGEANWYSSFSINRLKHGDHVTLTFNVDRSTSENFFCVAINFLTVYNRIEFRPRLAYGPDNVKIDTKSEYPFEDGVPPITCLLPAVREQQPLDTGVELQVLMIELDTTDKRNCSRVTSASTDKHQYTCLKWTPSYPGNYIFRCRAYNEKFPTLGATDEKLVKITKRPEVKIEDCSLKDTAPPIWIEAKDLDGCKCNITNFGFPLTDTANWVDGDTGKVIKSGRAPATLQAYSPGTGEKTMTFKCTANNSAGETLVTPSFTVNFIYGPSFLTLRTQPHLDQIEWNTTVQIECSLDKTYVNMDAHFTFSITYPEDKGYQFVSRTNNTAEISSTYEYIPYQVGRVTAECKAENTMRKNLTATKEFKFLVNKKPEVTISNCPDYDKRTSIPSWAHKDIIAKCECRLTDGGYPETSFSIWRDVTNRLHRRSIVLGSVIIIHDGTQTFECTAHNLFGSPTVSPWFTVRVAYGPKEVTIGSDDVPKKNTSMQIYCSTLEEDVHPDVEFEFNVTHPSGAKYVNKTRDRKNTVHGWSVYTQYEYVPNQLGKFTVQCTVKNKEIDTIKKVESRDFYVEQRPTVHIESCPPSYSSPTEWVTVDELSGCKCVVSDEGYPPIKDVLWFDEKGHNISSNGSLYYNPKSGDDEKMFICNSANIGGALDPLSFLIRLVWGPTDINMEFSSKDIKVGNPIEIRCSVYHGYTNPSHNISFNIIHPNGIGYERKNEGIDEIEGSDYVIFQVTPSQKGKIIAQCIATNSQNDTLKAERTKEISVTKRPEVRINNCPFFKDPPQVTQWVTADALLDCQCQVVETGYPETNNSIWIDEKQNIIVTRPGNASLQYSIQYGDSLKTFSCEANNSAGGALIPNNFSVHLAYGPKTVGIKRITPDDKNVVGSEVEIGCLVYTQTVNPSFVSQLKILHPVDTGYKYLRNESGTSGPVPYVNVIFGYTPLTTGRISARCIITNSEVSTITANSNIEFFVKGNSTVKLKDCPRQFERAKEGSCKCVLDDPGNPVSVPAWYDKDDNLLVNGTSSGAVLNVNESLANVTFNCKGSSWFGTSEKVNYTTDFVYGPGDVNIGVDEKRTNYSVVTIYCEIFLSQIRPGYILDLYILGEGKQTVAFESQGSSGDDFRRQVYEVDISNKRGNLTAECLGKNVELPEIMNSTKMTHQIDVLPKADITNCSVYESIKSGGEMWIAVGGPDDPLVCNCTLTDSGNPQNTSRAQWLDGKTGDVIRKGNPVAELNYLRLSGEQSKTFKCQAINPAGLSDDTTSFEIKYAYGPDNVSVNIDKVQTTNEKTVFYCETHSNSTRPGLIHEFQILEDNIVYNSSNPVRDLVQGVTRDYFVFPTPKGVKGNFTAECKANNSKFLFLGAVSTLDFTIEELPTAEIVNCPIYTDVKPEAERWIEIGGRDDPFVCDCNLTNPGFPTWSSGAQWVDGKTGEVLVEETSSRATLNYNRKPGEDSKTFKCQAKNSAGVSEKTTSFEVHYATGPESVSIVLDEGKTTREKAVFYCEVETASVKPNWTTTFKIKEAGTSFKFSHQDIFGQVIRDYFDFETASIRNGNFTAECMVNNSKIHAIGAMATMEYTVEELPSSKITGCPVYENRVPGKTIWLQAVIEEPVVCGCSLSNPGFPTYWSRAQWVDGKTGEVIEEDKSVATLEYTRFSNENTKTFKCQAKNSAGISTIYTSFSVSYYYGPTHLTLTLEETPKFDKDADIPPANITVICAVPSNLNPSSSIKVVGVNSDGITVVNVEKPADTKEAADKSTYKFIFPPPLDEKKRPAINMNLKCIAENDVNSTLTVEDGVVLEMPVLELSGCPPLIKGTQYGVETLKHSTTCTCRLKNKGTPKGELRWVDAKGMILSTGKKDVVLKADTNDHDSTFTCQAITLWSVVEEILFTPQFKVLPDNPPSIQLTVGAEVTTIKDGDTVEMDTGEWLYVKCNVDGGIPVVSNVTLTYGSKSQTSIATELTTNITIDRSFNQVKFTCQAGHETGQYSKVTSFKLNVLHPAILQSYSINDQNSTSVQVQEGDRVTFVCLAWGNPGPIMAIRGQLTNVHLKGERTRFGVNAYKLVAVILSVNVSDTDTFICTALTPPRHVRRKKRCAEEVTKTDQETASDLIVIGSPVPVFPKDNPPVAKSRPSGELLIEVEVISHPAPTAYVFAKETGREGNTSTYKEIPRDKYIVEVTKINCRLSSVKLWTADYEIDENTRYRFSVNNAIGTPSNFYLGTRKEEEPNSVYRQRSDADFHVAIGLAAALACLLIGVIGVVIAYLYWILRGKGSWKRHIKNKELRKQRQRNGLSVRLHPPVHISPVQLPPEEQSPVQSRAAQMKQRRLWWQNL